MHLSPAIKRFRDEVCIIFAKSGLKGFKETQLQCVIALFYPDKRRRDIDNVLKGILDSLQWCGAIDDDKWIQKLTIEVLGVQKGGNCVIQLIPYEKSGN